MNFSTAIISFFLLFVVQATTAQIVINEISSAQNTGYADEDSDYPDWIELYNQGTTAVDLKGYQLESIENKRIVWIFPQVIIQPQDHLLVFASGKDRKDVIDHWEVPVYPDLTWNYFRGVTAPPVDWNLLSNTVSTWNTGVAGIGYGDGDDSTTITPITTLYMRMNFNIADTSIIATGLMAIDYDDSFVAYLNGVEIARNNIGVLGTPPSYNEVAYEEREAKVYQGGNPEFYFLSKEKMNTAKQVGGNVFSVEIHNTDSIFDDMSAIPYFLLGVKDNSITYFTFPATSNLHTNFTISSYPSRIRLYDNNNQQIDEVIMTDLQVNHSRGRLPDGGNNWCLFNTPTPDTLNVLASCYQAYANVPTIDLPAGFYTGTQSTSISSNEAGNIYYTLDGSIPTTASSIYTSPISISENTVIKAIVYPLVNTILPSKIDAKTYFIDENVSLPVISISTDPFNLWDYNEGIYVMGPSADTTYPFVGANFWKGWEKESYVEYFDRSKKKGFGMEAGLKIHGNFSKSWPQKSFRILAKDDYNEKWINYRLFEEKPYRNRFKNFNIRNAGIDYNTAHFRDALMHRAAIGLNFEHMAYEPCVVFLNGQYWGVYGIRERQDDSFIEENYDNTSKEKIDLLRFEGDVLAGSNEDFLAMMDYINASDLSDSTIYNDIKNNYLDVYNVADYFIAETFYCNVDWISEESSNNVKYWRTNNPVGKWRYILWDTDLGLGLIQPGTLLQYNYFQDILSPAYTTVHSNIIRGLLENPSYENYFINRYADLLNTKFHPDSLEKVTLELKNDLAPEMTRHFNKWGGILNVFGTQLATSTNFSEWEQNVDTILLFTDQRAQIVRNHLQTIFTLTNQVDVRLEISPPKAGMIKINTITPGTSPWIGVYFNGVPITITAMPNQGYTFSHWTSSSVVLDNFNSISNTVNIPANETLTAVFRPLENGIQVYPNPSSDFFFIKYETERDEQISIALINSEGKKVKSIIPHSFIHPGGVHEIQFNIKENNLAIGMYFIEFKTANFTSSIKLIVD